jgi:hypothetical protein
MQGSMDRETNRQVSSDLKSPPVLKNIIKTKVEELSTEL